MAEILRVNPDTYKKYMVHQVFGKSSGKVTPVIRNLESSFKRWVKLPELSADIVTTNSTEVTGLLPKIFPKMMQRTQRIFARDYVKMLDGRAGYQAIDDFESGLHYATSLFQITSEAEILNHRFIHNIFYNPVIEFIIPGYNGMSEQTIETTFKQVDKLFEALDSIYEYKKLDPFRDFVNSLPS